MSKLSEKDLRKMDEALAALDAAQLRTLLRQLVQSMERREQEAAVATILSQATHQGQGYRPVSPGEQAALGAESFVEAATRVGLADPARVDQHLRAGTEALLAGDFSSARRIFTAMLTLLAQGDVDLGQDEMVEEVLGVDLTECLACQLVALYHTTPSGQRADALVEAFSGVEGVILMTTPLASMERVAPGPLPDLADFFCVSRPAAGILGKLPETGCRPEAAIRGNFLPRWTERLRQMP